MAKGFCAVNYKIFTPGIVWLCMSILVIVIFSTQDKEWWIGGENIKNICDLMAYVENDDIRDFGMLVTFPVFFTCSVCILDKKSPSRFLYLIIILIAGVWLWRFIFRYQFCLG